MTQLLSITKDSIKTAPNSTGVYLFKKGDKILYIGKAISLKARLLSHLENAKLDHKETLIIQNSEYVELILTDSEFKALLLESSLIQKYLPKYNRRWKDDKSYLYIKITIKEQFPKIYTVRKENHGKSLYFGPFPSQKDVQEILRIIRRLFPFCMQKNMTKRTCFYSKIGLCNPCPNEIDQLDDIKKQKQLKKQYRKNIRSVISILNGKIELVLKGKYKQLKQLSKNEHYEEALRLRNKIQHFEQMIFQTSFSSDISLHFNQSSEAISLLIKMLNKYKLNINSLHRIECYDISNLFQKDATASMVVFIDGMPEKSEYKRFKIKSKTIKSDFEMLEEIFMRRFKQSWDKPDLIVVDGGTPQVLRMKHILARLHQTLTLIGIAKHPDRLVINTPDRLITIRPSINNLGFNLIRSLRDEAHRFARKYHLLLRSKSLML